MHTLNMIKKPFLITALIFVLLISGCSSQLSGGKAPAGCGNSVVDAGEECDKSSCPGSKVCTDTCRCEGLVPPSLPE